MSVRAGGWFTGELKTDAPLLFARKPSPSRAAGRPKLITRQLYAFRTRITSTRVINEQILLRNYHVVTKKRGRKHRVPYAVFVFLFV